MILQFAASSLAAATAGLLAFGAPGASAVNFVIIQPDDMQFYEEWGPPPYMPWDGGYPGQEYPGTSTLPWINKLRTDGLTMTQAYAAAPKCGTSRYSTVTGRYATRSAHSRREGQRATPVKDNFNPADASIPNTKLRDVGQVDDGQDCSVSNVAKTFSNAGYETGMVGKWHLSKNNLVTGADGDVYAGVQAEIVSCGFNDVEAMYPDNLSDNQQWSDGLSHNMEYVAYKAVEFIQNNEDNDWFLYVNPTVPHSPAASEAMDIDCRITTDGDFSSEMTDGWSVKGMTAEFGDNCTAYRENVRERAGSDENDDLGAIWVDDAIGAIYTALEDTNQLDDTLILFQLDHGKHRKDKIWEGGIRIPQFVHYPNGIAAGSAWSGLVSTIDIGPTMLDYAGITAPYSMDGKSWKDAIDPVTGAEAEWKYNRCLFFESSTDRAVRCGCDKFLLLGDESTEQEEAEAAGWWTGQEALFNLCDSSMEYVVADSATSSLETENIMDSEPMKAADLRSLLQCHLNRTDASITPLYEECTGDIATPSPTVTIQPTTPVANNGGVPELIEYSPWQDDVFTSQSDFVFSATVLDDDIDKVRFNLRYPNGTRTGFSVGTQASSSGDLSTWTKTIDTTEMTGIYGMRIDIMDNSDSVEDVCFPDDCSGWIEFLVADTAADVVDAARSAISEIIMEGNRDGVNLAAKFVRHGFHDCVGGCDGCVDMANGDNAGLDVPIDALKPVVDMFEHPGFGVTRADIWVLAALEGAFISQDEGDPDNREFSMDWIGRPNCEDTYDSADCVDEACQTGGPDRELPSPDLTTHELLEFFSNEFGFDERDTVAIMGAHTLGNLARENSGFNGINGWVGNTMSLANGYYGAIVGSTADLANCDLSAESTDSCVDDLKNNNRWTQAFYDNTEFGTPDRWEWEKGDQPDHTVMVNADMALVRDLSGMILADGEVDCSWRGNSGCPHAAETIGIAAEYAEDNGLFLQEFEDAYKTMLHHGDYDTGSSSLAACLATPCPVGTVERRALKENKN